MPLDIGSQTLKVGNALTSVRIDEMVASLAKGIAWGQFDLDKVGIDVARMMGVPGTVTIGDDKLSMLEAGFLPTFYQFVDSILELKMEVKMREEEVRQFSSKDTSLQSTSAEGSVEVSSHGVRASTTGKSKSVYSRSIDAAFAQKYNHDLSASSLMRTKIVPKPPPDVLVERIKILLERMRTDAEAQVRREGATNVEERVEQVLAEMIEARILGRVQALKAR